MLSVQASPLMELEAIVEVFQRDRLNILKNRDRPQQSMMLKQTQTFCSHNPTHPQSQYHCLKRHSHPVVIFLLPRCNQISTAMLPTHQPMRPLHLAIGQRDRHD